MLPLKVQLSLPAEKASVVSTSHVNSFGDLRQIVSQASHMPGFDPAEVKRVMKDVANTNYCSVIGATNIYRALADRLVRQYSPTMPVEAGEYLDVKSFNQEYKVTVTDDKSNGNRRIVTDFQSCAEWLDLLRDDLINKERWLASLDTDIRCAGVGEYVRNECPKLLERLIAFLTEGGVWRDERAIAFYREPYRFDIKKSFSPATHFTVGWDAPFPISFAVIFPRGQF